MTPPVHDCYAITPPGFEGVTASELRDLGLDPLATEPGGVTFQADLASVYRANLWLRTANRILLRIGAFHASSFHELERRARRLPWTSFLIPGTSVRFRITSRKSRLYHQDAIAERLERIVKEALSPPSMAKEVSGAHVEQLFVVRFWRDECTVSVDSSGELLHRRGYREAVARAPLRETIAAGMLLAAGYDGKGPLVDPFCGSGTICVEGVLIARQIAPGSRRSFAFEAWPGFQESMWQAVSAEAARAALQELPAIIRGSDRDAGAIAAARANAERAGVQVEFEQKALSAVEPVPQAGWVVTNPPYGERMGDRTRLRNLYATLGRLLRERWSGWRVALLVAHDEHERELRLPLEAVILSNVGGIRVKLLSGTIA